MKNQLHILLVEDNEGDILLTREALEETTMATRLSVVTDGEAAIDFISQRGNHRDAKLPDLLLLDINLPKKNGHEVLKFIKENKKLKHIPVIMLTTSSSEKDICQAYSNHANCYITKPVEVNEFLSVVAAIESFWTSVVSLAKKNDNE